jgi:hypothetical protein
MNTGSQQLFNGDVTLYVINFRRRTLVPIIECKAVLVLN